MNVDVRLIHHFSLLFNVSLLANFLSSSVPQGYKFSWSVRGVLNAGLNAARWREGGEVGPLG